MTMLHAAAYNNKEEILEFLLSQQAIVDEKDYEGKDIVNSAVKRWISCKTLKILNIIWLNYGNLIVQYTLYINNVCT